MSGLVLVACGVATFVAGMLQRLTGIGYGLVASPILVVAVGPDEAIRLVIITSLGASALALWVTRAHCRPRQILPLVPFAVLAIWPAARLSQGGSSSFSSLLAGFVVLAALAIAVHPRGIGVPSMWAQASIAGTLSGAMNAVAALGGPMAAVYGIGQRWGSSMVPNLQLFLLATSLAVLGVRGLPAATGPAPLTMLALSALAGVVVAGQLARTIELRHARVLTVIVAVAGASVAIVRGALQYV